MAITRIRAEQQVSQSSITATELSASVAGAGITGSAGLPLSLNLSQLNTTPTI